MGSSPYKARSLYTGRLIVFVWVLLGLSLPIPAQIQCPPPDGRGPDGLASARDYGTACRASFVLLGGTVTPYVTGAGQAPGDGSVSASRILASTGPPYTVRLTDGQLQGLLAAGRPQLDTELIDLARHFAGSALDYRSAAAQFNELVRARVEAARNYFLAAALAHPDNDAVVSGLLDAMALLAERWMIKGNEALAEALYRRYQEPSTTLFQVNNGLRDADRSFRNAVAVYMDFFHSPLPTTALTLYDLILARQPRRTDYTGIGYRDIRLLARAAGRKAFAERELGARLFALLRYAETFDTLVTEELDILGEIGSIAPVYEAIDTPEAQEAVNEAVRELLAEHNRITTLLHYLEGGKNVLGLDDDYVEFRFNREIHDPDRHTNFTQVRQWAQDQLTDAQRSFDVFQRQHREFEQFVTAYRLQVQQHLDFYDREIAYLCGSTDPDACPGGSLQEARQRIEQATLRIDAVLQEISNLQGRIANLIEASDAIRAIHEQLAQMVIAYGEQRASLIQEMARLQAEAAVARAEQDAIRAWLAAGRRAALAAAMAARTAGQIDATMQRQAGERQALMERLQALERAEFIRAEDRIRAVEVQRFVKDTTLEILSKRIELKMAELTLTQETATLEDRQQRLQRLRVERENWRRLDAAADPMFRDPTLRIIRDEFAQQYMSDYEETLRRVYLTGRALAYEINRCPGQTCPPLIARLDDVLQIVDLDRLRRELRRMDELRVDHESRYRPGRPRIQIELSKLLGFRTRMIRGEIVPYKRQFHDCLVAQVEGTAVPPECPRFEVLDQGRTVIFRFPIEIGAHLQEFEDPAFTPLLPADLANLRIRWIRALIEGPSPQPGRFAYLRLSYGLTNEYGNLIGDMSQRGPDSNVNFLDRSGRDFIRHYNAVGAGATRLEAAVGVTPDFDRFPANDTFIYRTLGFSNYVLTLSVDPRRAPGNPDLIGSLSDVEDILFEFTCDAYTLP